MYSDNIIKNWAKKYIECKSFSKVAKHFRVNIKTISKYLHKHKEELDIVLIHVERENLTKLHKKKCNDCKKIQDLGMFEFVSSTNLYRAYCKKCRKIRQVRYKENHKKEMALYRKKYNLENIDLIKEKNKIRYEKNREYWLKKQKETYHLNKDKIRKRRRVRHKERIKHDINYRLRHAMRGRLSAAIKCKVGHTFDYIGCDTIYLKKYIESLWEDGMTWENYGYYGWHIDHIIPLSYFNLTKEEQIKKACHYTNLQPLWAKDNLRKGSKIPKEFGNV